MGHSPPKVHPFCFRNGWDQLHGEISVKAASVLLWLYFKDSQRPSYAVTMLFLWRIRDVHVTTGFVELCQNAVVSVKVSLHP